MISHLEQILAEIDKIPNRIVSSLAGYLLALMLVTKGQCGRGTAKICNRHESSVSRLLAHPQSLVMAKAALNRSAKRRLKTMTRQKNKGRIFVIIDATFVGRSGKGVENRHKYKHSKGYVEGHKFVNFVMLLGEEVVPLSVIAHYSPEYCEQYDLEFKSEVELVVEWLNLLPQAEFMEKSWLSRLMFLLDSFYDVKAIQNSIRRLGSHFTSALKSSRMINGVRVKEFFTRHRCLTWKTVYTKQAKDGKKRRYRARQANEPVSLKHVGAVSIVCSERKRLGKKIAAGRKRKYLACSDTSVTLGEIIKYYEKRWMIEVWHKQVKQNHGYGSCRAKQFSAVYAHVCLVAAAYNLQRSEKGILPKVGTTREEFAAAKKTQESAKVINLFGGKEKIKSQAQAALRQVVGF
jgi:hypothetical protein